MEPVISVQGLVKRYGKITALDGISFQVFRGEIFGLLGPNGAGKTTAVECLEGLRVPDAGQIAVLGEIPSPTNYALKARLGIQLQGTAFLPRLTVVETLGLFARFYPHRRDISDLLDLLALKEKRHSQVRDLSGGQRQRLAVALALVNDPELLVLDEPTAGLDPQARRSLWEVIWGLKNERKTTLLTTHYMEEAEYLCDRVAIMDHGKIIVLGSPRDLVAENFREIPLEIELSIPAPELDFSRLPGVTRTISVEENRVVLYSASPLETIRALFASAERGELSISDLTLRRARLEDVYLALTGRRIRE